MGLRVWTTRLGIVGVAAAVLTLASAFLLDIPEVRLEGDVVLN